MSDLPMIIRLLLLSYVTGLNDKYDMMSSSLKTKNILSQQKVERLVSSGAQKAIKETGQGLKGR